ncbi:MAG: hypothetical protein QOG41_687, partial [Thermoleophilaceae bacterium]|nr:hypothetical protein [Thermoleophilaceae bacterium]
PACGTNDEWWGANHDEHSTRAYGTDARPPGTPGGLVATRTGGSIALKWFAPGDDWLCGDAKTFRILGSGGALDHAKQGTELLRAAAAKHGKSEEGTVPDVAGRRWLAVQYLDEAGNWGHLATVAVPKHEGQSTCSGAGGSFGGYGVGPGEKGGRPRVALHAPVYSTNVSGSRRFTLRWSGQAPCGVNRFGLQVRSRAAGWRTIVKNRLRTKLTFTGRPGRTYEFRLRAHGRDGRLSRFAVKRTVVPRDDRSPRLIYGKPWRRASASSAYLGTLMQPTRRRARMAFRLRFRRLAVIAPRSPRGGRLRIRIAGRPHIVSLRGSPRARAVVFRSRPMTSSRRLVTIRYLGGGDAAIDGIALTR